MKNSQRLARLEAASRASDAPRPYCWAWAWQTDDEALAVCNEGRETPLAADQVIWIRAKAATRKAA